MTRERELTLTRGERDRAYRVLMHALAEEARIMKLSSREIAQKSREIHKDCYSDTPPKKDENFR